jgi:hypothetical protein
MHFRSVTTPAILLALQSSRNKLGEAFVEAWHADFSAWRGRDCCVRTDKPHEYLKVVADLLPKELKIERSDELSSPELDQRIRQLAEIIGVEVGIARLLQQKKRRADRNLWRRMDPTVTTQSLTPRVGEPRAAIHGR